MPVRASSSSARPLPQAEVGRLLGSTSWGKTGRRRRGCFHASGQRCGCGCGEKCQAFHPRSGRRKGSPIFRTRETRKPLGRQAMQAPGATTFGKRAASGSASSPPHHTSPSGRLVFPSSSLAGDHGPHTPRVGPARSRRADCDEPKRRRMAVAHAHACCRL